MAKKETIEVDVIVEKYHKDMENRLIWRYGRGSCHYNELDDDQLEYEIRNYERYLTSSKKEPWIYASWKRIDENMIKLQWLKDLLQWRLDKLFSDFKYVKV